MRRLLVCGVTAIAALAFALPEQASAQGIFVGGGVTFPVTDYGEYADVGWQFEGGFTVPISEAGLSVLFDGLYGTNGHNTEGVEDQSTKLLGGFGGLVYSLADEGEGGLFFFGEAGILRHEFDAGDLNDSESDSETAFAWGGGAGYGYPLNETLSGWFMARYLQGSFDSEFEDESETTAFFGVMVGLTFNIGG